MPPKNAPTETICDEHHIVSHEGSAWWLRVRIDAYPITEPPAGRKERRKQWPFPKRFDLGQRVVAMVRQDGAREG